jgi:hypothetical protein
MRRKSKESRGWMWRSMRAATKSRHFREWSALKAPTPSDLFTRFAGLNLDASKNRSLMIETAAGHYSASNWIRRDNGFPAWVTLVKSQMATLFWPKPDKFAVVRKQIVSGARALEIRSSAQYVPLKSFGYKLVASCYSNFRKRFRLLSARWLMASAETMEHNRCSREWRPAIMFFQEANRDRLLSSVVGAHTWRQHSGSTLSLECAAWWWIAQVAGDFQEQASRFVRKSSWSAGNNCVHARWPIPTLICV